MLGVERKMDRRFKIGVFIYIVIFLLGGCVKENKSDQIKKMVISEPAADALLLEVDGIDNFDDLDALIEELSLFESLDENVLAEGEIIENSDLSTVAVESVQDSNESPSEPINQVEQPEKVTESTLEKPVEENIRTVLYMGKIRRISKNKIIMEVVQIQKIDKAELETLTPAERRSAVQNSIIYTSVLRETIINTNTEILSNGGVITQEELSVGRFIQVTENKVGIAKKIRLLALKDESK